MSKTNSADHHPIKIKKSYTFAKIQTGVVALISITMFIITSVIINKIDNITVSDTSSLALLINMIVFAIGIMAILTTWANNTQKNYYLDGKSIIIENSQNLTGRTSQEIISPKQISRIRLEKSSFGNMFDYGTIIIETNHINKEIYKLKNIKRPEKVIAELRARL